MAQKARCLVVSRCSSAASAVFSADGLPKRSHNALADSVARAVVIAVTGLALGVLARVVDQVRMWLAGGVVVLGTTVVALLVEVQPWLEEGELELRVDQRTESGLPAASTRGRLGGGMSGRQRVKAAA